MFCEVLSIEEIVHNAMYCCNHLSYNVNASEGVMFCAPSLLCSALLCCLVCVRALLQPAVVQRGGIMLLLLTHPKPVSGL